MFLLSVTKCFNLMQMPTFLRVYYECPSKIIGDFGYEDVLFLKKRDVHLTCNHLMDAALNVSQPDVRDKLLL